MTTIESSPEAVAATRTESGPGRLLAAVVNWLTGTDHKIVGRLFAVGGVLGLLDAIIVSIVLGVERTDGNSVVTDAEILPQLFDAQRVALVFGAALPLTMGLCIAVVPLQLGARALAFPRLAAAGFWMWLGGLVLAAISLINNGGTLGGDADMVDLFIASHALMALGLTAAATSVATTVLTTRAPGMTMRRVPFFSMSALLYSLGLVLVMPVLVGTLSYLFLDHRNARTGFGGNEGILTWAGWIFTQPATFLFAIPAIGVFAELLPITFRKRTPARGVIFAGLGLVGVAALGAVTQILVFNLPWAGSGLNIADSDDFGDKLADIIPWGFFYLLPVLGMTVILLLGLFLAKPEKGVRPNITAAFAFSFFGFGMVLVGMLGTVLYAIDDLALQGTVFEEAALVYVVYGAALGILGGLAHWAPKLWGRTLPTGQVLPLALLGVTGTVLASFPHYIAGFLDQPGLYATGGLYDDSDLTIWNILVLVGHALMALTVLAFIGLLLKTATGGGDPAPDDPWEGQTLEWTTISPAPPNNFVEVPTVASAEPLLDLKPSNAGANADTADADSATPVTEGSA